MVALLNEKGWPVFAWEYRSLNITSIVCQMLVMIVINAIVGHLHKWHLLHDAQYGFLIGRSYLKYLLSALNTTTQLIVNG